MSDTYGTNSQNPVEAQEAVETVDTVAEDTTTAADPESRAYKPTWIQPVEQLAEAQTEGVIEQPVEKPKVKAKKKAAVAKKPSKRGKSAELDEFGFRKGSLRSKAAQLYASAKGATLDEVKKKCGSIQYNMLTELKKRGFKVTTKEIEGKANRPASRYFLKSKKR